ncbi:DUF1415 domain-containing protein [Alkalimarinus alittae]|uniref:DUF1415 domain-containing protein n=1 Tax=Alkalimarinus alittae TaxID=2961619 RepID=A0ABY6N0Y2_9ALTE|nr:DUF1415 domain-containing protein [Alkalimarinus alittae]UZE95659.1 DUF1415 domain-containing protein [Alkalimarinus alittae]
MPSDELIIEQTKAWVSSIVVGENFCPFARKEVERDTIRYRVVGDKHDKEALENALVALIAECKCLDENDSIETTVIIYSEGFSDFQAFLELLELANNLMADKDYEGVYQLASFHPDYCFADALDDDPANYTNRSPYPALHLIREESIACVLEGIDDPERIPARNVRYAREKGLAYMQEKLKACSVKREQR